METPRAPVDGRYQFVEPIGYQGDGLRWLATDAETGERVVVAVVASARAAKLETTKGCLHENLAGVLDVIRRFTPDMVPGAVPSGHALAVAEFVPGRTLVERLVSGGVNAPRAVAWWLRMAEAVGRVHARGGVITTISPYAMVAKPRGRAIPPVLTQLLTPSIAATLSPERLKGSAPTAADDVWALYASLYWALMGAPPYSGSSREELLGAMTKGEFAPLGASGIDEPVLQEILVRGLTADRNQRTMALDELKKSLDAWERGLGLPPRPVRGVTPRSFSGIVSGGLSPAATLSEVVFEFSALPDNPAPEAPSEPKIAAPGQPEVAAAAVPAPEPAAAVQTPEPAAPPEPAAAPEPAHQVRAQPAAPAKGPSVNPFAKKRAVWPYVAGIAALMLGGAAYFFVGSNSAPLAAPTPSAVGAPSPPADTAPAASAPQPAESSSAASESETKLTPEESTDACVASYFEDDTFVPGVQFGFVCEAGDHRDLTNKLYELSEAKADLERKAAAHEQAPKVGKDEAGFKVDTVTGDAGVEDVRRPLGWYELLASAVIRKGCCPNAAPVTLPETKGWCEQLQDVVRDLAEDSSRSGDLSARVKRFDKAVDCLFANRVRRPYRYKTEPITEQHEAAFQEFLAHAAVSDAKRRSLGQ